MPTSLLLPGLAGVALSLCVGLIALALYARGQRRAGTGVLAVARAEAERIRTDALLEAETAKSQVLVDARIEALTLRDELDREIQRRREECERLERRTEERGRAQERKVEEIDNRERNLTKREETLAQRDQALRSREGEADRLAQEQRQKLERIAGLTAEDARREILQRVEDEARGQAAALVRDIKEQA